MELCAWKDARDDNSMISTVERKKERDREAKEQQVDEKPTRGREKEPYDNRYLMQN